MKKSLIALTLTAASLLTAHSAFAQSAPKDDQLYKAFGEKPGLVALMDDFMVRLLADPRTGPHFQPADQKHVKEQLVDQFCDLSGGPCKYKGADMQSSHANLDIKKSDFHALVEVLQQAMDAKGIPFTRQNQMLALLAPMNRDIITPKCHDQHPAQNTSFDGAWRAVRLHPVHPAGASWQPDGGGGRQGRQAGA